MLIMRAAYWSNSKFAGQVRKVFGLPPQPTALTAEGWDEFNELENSISKFGVKLIDSFDIVQKIIYWPTDSIQNIAYRIGNLLDSTHVLKTTTKRGQWSDLTTKIPDALMFAIIDYVEKECFWMNVAFMSKKPEDMSEAVWNCKDQNYIRRKLFPITISDTERGYHGIQYIKFQIENSDVDSVINYNEIIDAYNFAKTRYFAFDAYEESGYNALQLDVNFKRLSISDAQRERFKVIDELEKTYEAEVTKHCCNIVKHRQYLWT